MATDYRVRDSWSSPLEGGEVYEVLGQVDHSVQLEIVLCTKQREGAMWGETGVKGHTEYIITKSPEPLLILTSLTQSIAVGGGEGVYDNR